MPKRYESRIPKINQMLELMKTTPMDRHEMAEFIGVSYKSLCKYVSALHKERKIFIASKVIPFLKNHNPLDLFI
jgi:hypothetical protein